MCVLLCVTTPTLISLIFTMTFQRTCVHTTPKVTERNSIWKATTDVKRRKWELHPRPLLGRDYSESMVTALLLARKQTMLQECKERISALNSQIEQEKNKQRQLR